MRDEAIFSTSLVKVGVFRCRPDDPAFSNSGPAENHCFVFPRTSVWIQHAGQRPFVADPNVVTFYNPGQEYRRAAIDARGDLCEWYAVREDLVRELAALVDPAAADAERCGFRWSHVASDDRTYYEQRQVYAHVESGAAPDTLFVEETTLRLLERLLTGGRSPARPAHGRSLRARRDVAEGVKTLVARSFRDRVELTALARALGVSVFRLCRAFRAETGTTIHAYLNRIRVRASLEPLIESRESLVTIALEHGFSSHSHYTAAFRAAVGTTPSEARRHARATAAKSRPTAGQSLRATAGQSLRTTAACLRTEE